jgi:IMP dehydrogenase
MTEIDLGAGKRGRRAWAFDDVAVVPSRRTRDPQDVSTTWNIDAYKFDLPVLGRSDGQRCFSCYRNSIGKLGGLGVLDLEGLWTRYEDPSKQLAEIAKLGARKSNRAHARDLCRAD